MLRRTANRRALHSEVANISETTDRGSKRKIKLLWNV